MKIGVYFSANKSGGGGYQYALSFLEVLKNRTQDELVVFNLSPDLPKNFRNASRFQVVDVPEELVKMKKRKYFGFVVEFIHILLLHLRLFDILNFFDKHFRLENIRKLINKGDVKLMLFPSPHNIAAKLDIPTIVPIHDLQHRLSNFPEVSQGRAYLNKEYLFSQIVKRTDKILVDSKIGQEDVINCYHINSKKIEILGFLPPNYLNPNPNPEDIRQVKQKYHLPDRFIFYPAQFWPHKNHINLAKALTILKEKGLPVPLALSGGGQARWGVEEKIKAIANENKLQIFFLGYVDNADMACLYKLAAALVMPTSFGPTNIPVLEAWLMRCPVLYSNIRGCREQAGDGALLFDPLNPNDIAEKIQLLLNDETLQKKLKEQGDKRLGLWTFTNFKTKLNQIIDIYAN